MAQDREAGIRAESRRKADMAGRSRGSRLPNSSGIARAASKTESEKVVEPATAEQQQVVFAIFAVMTIAITIFQKIGYALGAHFAIPVVVPITFGCLLVGLLFAKPVFRPERAILYLVVVVVLTLSTTFLSRESSVGSMTLFYLLYLPMLVSFETSRATYRRCLAFFSGVMVVFAVIVWVQHAIQFTIGWQYWPDLDKLVPRTFLVPEFNYIQAIEWDLNLMKPSGICFLEVSILSQFITFAFLIELLILQRTWRTVFLGATLFATFAGTGLFLLAVSIPIVFSRLNTRMFFIILATVFVALLVALQLHWFDLVAHRFGEFQQSGSSANSRFIAPLDRVRQALIDQRGVYSGVGAGQIERGGNTFWWPLVKVSVEYGLIEGVLFYIFYLFSMFDNPPSRRLAIVLVVWFSFEGTLLTPLNPLACVMLSTMFFVPGEGRSRRRSQRTDRGTPSAVAAAA